MKAITNPQEGTESKLYPRALFVYSAYWQKWSRVLRFMQRNVSQVEVDLQPMNPDRTINIRDHLTARSDRDVYSRYLPSAVVIGMVERFGLELTERLLNEDFLSKINWDLYRKLDNGGAEFDLIKLG